MNINKLIRDSVAQQWKDFAREHPRLAEVLDEQIVTEQVTEELADDSAYQNVLGRADAAIEIQSAIANAVMRWFARVR